MPCLVFTALGLKLDLWGARGPHVDHSVLDRSRRGIKSAGCKSGVSHFQPLTKKGIMMIMHHVFLLYYLYIYRDPVSTISCTHAYDPRLQMCAS